MTGLVTALAASVGRHGDRPAVIEADRSWSYAELAEQAGRYAAALVEAGVRPGHRVLLSMRPDAQGIAAMWGCWLAGAAFVPIEARAPLARNQRIVELTGARLLISHRPTALAGLISLDPVAVSAHPPWPTPVAGADAGYLIFTSGSTGEPKGVVVDGPALLRHCLAIAELELLGPATVTSQFHDLTFDPPQQYLWSALLVGAAVVAKPAGAMPPNRLRDFLQRHQVHCLGVSTRYLSLLAQAGTLEQPPPDRLRILSVGGEALPVATAMAFQASPWGRATLVNYYGPTEGVVAVSALALRPAWQPVPGARSVPVGAALAGRRLALQPPAPAPAEPLPAGVGELVVTGQPRAVGYLTGSAAPASTGHRFAGCGEAAVLRTGDLGIDRGADGIEIVGRLDDQVKIAGYRVDLGDVEHALRDTPGLADLAVLAVQRDVDCAIGACLVPEPGQPTPELLAAVRERAGALLPYMRPAGYLVLPSFPLTAHGKLDRHRLAALFADGGR